MSHSPTPSDENQTPFDAEGSPPKKPSQPKVIGKALWLRAMWNEMPRANQLALAAVSGALVVIVVSSVINLLMALGAPRLQTYPQAKAPDASQTVIMHPNSPTGDSPVTQIEVVQPSSQDTSSTQSELLDPLNEEDRQRLEARRREDQIIKEKRLLEDKKRAIEQQIADKQLEEQRAEEDRKRLEERRNQDKQVIEQRQQEAKRKLEEEQRKLDEEQRKIAEAR